MTGLCGLKFRTIFNFIVTRWTICQRPTRTSKMYSVKCVYWLMNEFNFLERRVIMESMGPTKKQQKGNDWLSYLNKSDPHSYYASLFAWLVCQTNRTLFYPMIKMGPSLFWSFWQRPHSLWKYFHSTQAREMFSSHQRSYQTVKAWLSLKSSQYALLWKKKR